MLGYNSISIVLLVSSQPIAIFSALTTLFLYLLGSDFKNKSFSTAVNPSAWAKYSLLFIPIFFGFLSVIKSASARY